MVIVLLATIFLATIFIYNPLVGGVVAWIWLGISLICYGVYRIALACSLLTINKRSNGLL